MNKIFLVPLVFLLVAACGNTPPPVMPGVIAVQVPDLPGTLSTRAGRLPKFDSKTMGDSQIEASLTDQKYNAVAIQTNSLIDFYNCVKISVNTKIEIGKCLKVK